MRTRCCTILTTCCGLIVTVALAAPHARAAELLIRNSRLIDGTGAAPRSGVSILARDGRIAAITDDFAPRDVPVLDVQGATVLPGLIDSHVHLGVVPGSAQRRDTPEVERTLRRRHLRAYLACGITTVLDTHVDLAVAREIQAWLAAGEPAPRFLTLGPGFVAPGGYLADGTPSMATPEDVAAHVALLAELGVVGVKVFLEPGFGMRRVWPTLSADVRAAIAREAAARGLPIYVHAQREEEMTMALAMGAHAFVHGGFYDRSPSDGFVERVAASGAYLATTFSVIDAQSIEFHPERLDDAVVRRTVPPLELATARDPASGRFLATAQIGMVEPWLPGMLHGPLARWFVTDASLAARLASSQEAVRRFWVAGVPIVVGSDSGNWPIDPYHFHGATTLRELELLSGAGIPPMDALAAATRVPARMLGLADEIGTVEVGKRADLIVVRDDPLRDLGALRTIVWTIQGGVARTPDEWMGGETVTRP